MNTRQRLPIARRNPESGVVAFVVAAMWMVLFGLAAFAVDMGYRYQSKFGIQAAADAAVRAGMPSFAAGNTSTATNKAIAMAGANGFPSGQVTVTPSGNFFQVDITSTPPSFFLGLFGSPSSFPLGATAIGEKTGGGGGALLFAKDGCASGLDGIFFNGSGPFNLNGDVQSNGHMNASGNFINLLGGATIQSPCAGEPTGWNASYISSAYSNGGPFADPFAGTTLAGVAAALGGCDFGDFVSTFPIPSGWWVYDGSSTPPHGVFTPAGGTPPYVVCSGGSLNVTDTTTGPPPPMFTYAPGVVFLAVGAITVGSNNGATFQAPPGSPHNIVFMSMSNGSSTAGGPAINLGNGALYTLNGAVYAPNGWVNWGGQDVIMTNGAIVANEMLLSSSPGKPWNLTGGGGGGGGGGSWKMHR